MNKLNKISTSINATRGLAEIEQQVNDIKNSNLTEIEKQKALKSHKQMIKTTLIVTILTCLVATILCGIICNVVEGNLKIILCLIIAGLATIGLISFGLFGRKLFQDFQNAYEKVDNGFDGLTQDVINILKPNNKEELLIKKYKKKMLFGGLLFLLAFGLLFIIISILDIEIYSPITIILALIITGIWYFFDDTYNVEIHRIKSGSTIKETYTDEQLETMRDNCGNLRDLALIDILASTGMRVGELVLLNKEDISFDERECIVFGKGDKERMVYFDARTKIHLQNYLNSRVDTNNALFVSLKAPYDRMKIGGIEVRLRELGKRLNIDKVHPHKFRRTLATVAIDKGMPIEQLQKLLGHQRIDTTLQYAMVKQSNVKNAHRKYIG